MDKEQFQMWVRNLENSCKVMAHYRTTEGLDETYTLVELAEKLSQHDKELAKKVVAWNDALKGVTDYVASKIETQK